MNKKSLLLILLCFILMLTGCSNGAPSYTDFVIPKGDESSLVPVDSYKTSQQKTYTNEGITPTYIAEYKSENELCSIFVYKEYYDVTLDYENGTPGEVGTAYAEMILKAFPDYPKIMEPYIYENIRVAFGGNTYEASAVEERMYTLFESLDKRYKEELSGYAGRISGGIHGFNEDGVLSYEEAIIIQMVPDALRPTSCSALSLWGDKTESGKPITLRVLEWSLGSENQLGFVNAVTHFKNGDKSFTSIGMLGLFDIISAINDDGVFAAILDVGSVSQMPFVSEGKKCYTFDIRHALEMYKNAKDVGSYIVENSGDYTFCHNLIITDENSSYCAENCVKEVSDAGKGFSILRDENTPIMNGISWDSRDSLCVVNSYAAKGNQDGFAGNENNIVRWAKYNQLVSGKDKFSVTDVKNLITGEKVNQYDVVNIHSSGTVDLIIVDYETGNIQVAFTRTEGVIDKPDFIDVGTYYRNEE